MRGARRRATLVGVVISAVALSVVLFLPDIYKLFSEGMCENTVIVALDPPESTWQATLFERSCGATTGFSTQVSVLRSGEPLTGSGNVFIATTGDGNTSAAEWGGPFAEVEWLDDDTLEIRFDAKAKVYLKEKMHQSVEIVFTEIE